MRACGIIIIVCVTPQMCGDSWITLSQHQVTRASREDAVPQLHYGTINSTYLSQTTFPCHWIPTSSQGKVIWPCETVPTHPFLVLA